MTIGMRKYSNISRGWITQKKEYSFIGQLQIKKEKKNKSKSLSMRNVKNPLEMFESVSELKLFRFFFSFIIYDFS